MSGQGESHTVAVVWRPISEFDGSTDRDFLIFAPECCCPMYIAWFYPNGLLDSPETAGEPWWDANDPYIPHSAVTHFADLPAEPTPSRFTLEILPARLKRKFEGGGG